MISCGGDSAPEERSNTFRLNLSDGVASLDPALISYQSAIWAGSQIYYGLVQLDADGSIAPCVAQTWSVDSSGLVWTFKLRDDVHFHEDPCFGEAGSRRVNAHDVKYSIERICDARTDTRGFWVYRERLDGAQEYQQATQIGNIPDGGLRGIRVPDSLTVEFTLTAPFAPFPSLLTMPYGYIVPREAIQHYGIDFGRHPVGCGAFEFVSWKDDIELKLQKHPQHFEKSADGRQLPLLDEVTISFIRESKSEFLEFQQENLDFVEEIDPSFARSVFDEEGNLQPDYQKYTLLNSPGNSVEYYGMMLDSTTSGGEDSPLLRSPELRKALNYAIDRENIVKYVLHGAATPGHYGILPPGTPGFSDKTKGFSFDREKAAALLAEAGYPNGEGLPQLTLQLGNSERTAAVAEAVQQMWREIGVDVELRRIDFPQHLSMVAEGKLALWRTSWISDYPDPENFLALFYAPFKAPKGPNTTRIALPELDSLYQEALSQRLSTADRYALYNEMERIVLDQTPWIVLYYTINQRLVQPWIRGVYLDSQNRLVLKEAEVVRETITQ